MDTINFYDDELLVVRDEQGEGWVAVRPICKALGLQNNTQQRKIEADPKLMRRHMTLHDSIGRKQATFCIPINQLNGWLFSINANKVGPQSREKLLKYQQECQEVLFRHFMPRGGTLEEIQATLQTMGVSITQLHQEQQEIKAIAHRQQDEIDELRELLQITLSDRDEQEIRSLVDEVKSVLHLDGRAITGHVRKTLGTSGVYNTPNLTQVKNVLRNRLGKGVFGTVPQAQEPSTVQG